MSTLAEKPKPVDGEVHCANPTCRNSKLNRTDMTCWMCGWDRFIPASDEMRAALRFNYVPPPRVEKPKAEPPVQALVFMPGAFQLPIQPTPQQTVQPKQQAAKPMDYMDVLKAYQDVYEKAYGQAITPRAIFVDPPSQPSLVDRFWKMLGL